MIIYNLIDTILTSIFFILSHVGFPSVATIPFVDEYLVTGFGNLHFVMQFIPPLAIIYAAFIVVMKFKIGMLTLRLIRIIR